MMSSLSRERGVRGAAVFLLALTLAASCSDDPTGPSETPGEPVGVVLASTDRVLTIFPVDAPAQAVTVGLGPDGSPVTLAVRNQWAVVPMGTVPAAVVVNVGSGAVKETVALPAGSGATGVAFLNDTIAIVANPGRNTVTPVNVLRGTAGAEITVGTYPQAATAVGDTVYVVNASLGPDFNPAGPSTVSVIAGTPAHVVRTIALSGVNAGAAAATADGRLVVVQAGTFGGGDGSLSIIDRRTLTETENVPGFGDFPGSVAVGPNGHVHVGSFSYGIAVWDPATNAFLRTPADAVAPGDIPSTAGIAFDEDGRLYTLVPDCRAPSRALRLTAAFDVAAEIATGTCPFAISFTRLPNVEP